MKLKGWLLVLHRDVGYFFTGVIVIYALSGIAVNHADSWNPNFVVEQHPVALNLPRDPTEISATKVANALAEAGETKSFRSFAFPSREKIKIYFSDGDIVANLESGCGMRESVRRRPVFHQLNMLHLNPTKWWRIFSDLFAGALILIALTGLLIPRGRNGLGGRGKWLVAAGLSVPLAAMFLP